VELAGIEPLGITNSLAPPTALPLPMKPGSVLLTGEAMSDFGVENSIILKPVGLPGMVSRSAICLAFSPIISLAEVTKMSSAPGLPSVPDARVMGLAATTLAIVSGTENNNAPFYLGIGNFRVFGVWVWVFCNLLSC